VLRTFIERATRRSIFRRRLPEALGGASIYVSTSAGLKYLFRSRDAIDPTLCDLAKEFVRSGDVVWDIGANVGLFTFSAAHLAGPEGQVSAFESDVWLIQLLRRSSRMQPETSAPVKVVSVAIAESLDLRIFNIASRSRAANFLSGYGSSQTGRISEQQTVVSVSLDWLSERLPIPNVIKIDVEGAEFEVLKGAVGLLEREHPRILCEVSSEHSAEVTALLKRFGYNIYDGEVPSDRRQELDAAPWSTVAIAAQH